LIGWICLHHVFSPGSLFVRNWKPLALIDGFNVFILRAGLKWDYSTDWPYQYSKKHNQGFHDVE